MYSGNISEAYDFELIVCRRRKFLPPSLFHFVIRGSGPLIEKVKSMVNKYEVSNVEIKTDMLSKDDLVLFLNKAFIFILPN